MESEDLLISRSDPEPSSIDRHACSDAIVGIVCALTSRLVETNDGVVGNKKSVFSDRRKEDLG